MKGVIVAAGLGHRLSPLTLQCPKPLISVNGQPLIAYTIEAFAHAGFREIGVVLGYKGHILANYLRSVDQDGLVVRCLVNPLYRLGNGSSIYAARHFVGDEPFVLAMADHLLSVQTLAPLLSQTWAGHVLCVDHEVRHADGLQDATKVWLDGQGRVLRIGKHLRRWHAVDAGVYLFQSRVFGYLEALINRRRANCSITHLARHLIARGDTLHTCDVSGAFWLDVDTPDDLIFARRVLRLGETPTSLESVA